MADGGLTRLVAGHRVGGHAVPRSDATPSRGGSSRSPISASALRNHPRAVQNAAVREPRDDMSLRDLVILPGACGATPGCFAA